MLTKTTSQKDRFEWDIRKNGQWRIAQETLRTKHLQKPARKSFKIKVSCRTFEKHLIRKNRPGILPKWTFRTRHLHPKWLFCTRHLQKLTKRPSKKIFQKSSRMGISYETKGENLKQRDLPKWTFRKRHLQKWTKKASKTSVCTRQSQKRTKIASKMSIFHETFPKTRISASTACMMSAQRFGFAHATPTTPRECWPRRLCFAHPTRMISVEGWPHSRKNQFRLSFANPTCTISAECWPRTARPTHTIFAEGWPRSSTHAASPRLGFAHGTGTISAKDRRLSSSAGPAPRLK